MCNKTKNKKGELERFLFRFLLSFLIIFYYPDVKQAFFPSQMDQLEKLLQQSNFEKGYRLSIARNVYDVVYLSVFNGEFSISTEVYPEGFHELEPIGNRRIFLAYAINTNTDEIYYLSKTRIETDTALKRLLHLELTVCGETKRQTAKIEYNGYEPVYDCVVPEREFKLNFAEE